MGDLIGFRDYITWFSRRTHPRALQHGRPLGVSIMPNLPSNRGYSLLDSMRWYSWFYPMSYLFSVSIQQYQNSGFLISTYALGWNLISL